ncbi:hypothetical protein [Deinococcus sp.]|uniref:hypothetical protein n=1 Tax=Deinococcus sp. TaxID=47478 RepID=UPI003B59E8D5
MLAEGNLTDGTLEAAFGKLEFSGPLEINKGGTYSGNWQSLDPDKPAVNITTSEPVIIENANIQSKGPLIRSRYVNANLTVRNTRGLGLNPGRPEKEGKRPGYFLHLENFQSATVENNEMVGTGGMYFHKFAGDPDKNQTIKIVRNKALNIDGRHSSGPDSFSDKGFYRTQFTQFNTVRNVVGAEIAWNEIINEPTKSRVEENINMYLSSGTPSSPIQIHDNYIQGAFAANPSEQDYGGGGIMIADGNAKKLEDASAYVRAFNNQVVGTSNQGIAITAGHDNAAYNNRVISSGLLPNGTPIASQNVGILVWDLYKNKNNNTFFNNAMYNNVVGWAKPLDSKNAQNPFWFPDCSTSGAQTCTNNTVVAGPITLDAEKQEYQRWQAKLRTSSIELGAK